MMTFSRFLDAAAFCRQHNLSIMAIKQTGYYKFTVFVDDNFVISPGPNNKAMPR